MIRWKIVTFAAMLTGFAATAGFYDLGFERWPLHGIDNGQPVHFQLTDVEGCFKYQMLGWLDQRYGYAWTVCREHLDQYDALSGFQLRSHAILGSGLVGMLALFGFALAIRFDPRPPKVVRGARLHAGSAGLRQFARACRRECKVHGPGVALIEPYALSRDRETRHFLVLGSVGGGKTQTMLNLMNGPLCRGDGLLVLDTKADMMAGLPARPEPLLVAPHDRRSLVWDVAADCQVKQDARELAARFIPPSTDPMWSHAAQEIFVGCVVHLQATRGQDWGWVDLEQAVTADTEVLTQYARDHNPTAVRLLHQPDSKTTVSILSTFQTHMRIVSVLAEAWPDGGCRRFSIRRWLHNPPSQCPLILQHDPGYPELSRVWIGSMLGLLASAVGSPSLAESKDRRIWMFLDEFPQLPAIQHFPTFLELGRSKGIAVVIGAQDTAQIRAVYGPDQAKSWFGMVGTKIITRVNASEAAEDLSRLIGDQEVERVVRTVSRAGGRSHVTETVRREIRRVVTASELASRLGPAKRGVRVLFLGLNENIYELELPYITLPKLREPTAPADWTKTPPSDAPPDGNGSNGGRSRPQVLSAGQAARVLRSGE
ncbi:MAG: type IV secretion system DNA-binding domain-containing protein [Alphaproteobacteria bacterium]|nr:type IV secretion system DNA-binding domain-containing protein [Alphaproteobacteria bacterium]MDE2111485.1 type IV secretion system DNA-binding domain-containing protein [Alphaproteobacteria bacterium]MDE2493970.1 type IV secretion system DNA-binding domain-containing protein [Alphaproteobacteria bacterium]